MPNPCPNPPVNCPGFINSPVLNNSSEAPDPFTFLGISFGSPYNPPLGKPFTAANCYETCTSVVSQQDADLCAEALAFMCENTDPTTGQSYTGQHFFFNQAVTATVHCPDGLAFRYTMPSNLFAGTTQLGANQSAFNYAQNLVKQHKVCLSDLPTTPACLNEVYDQSIVATTIQSTVGAVWLVSSGALPDGVGFIGSGVGGQFFGSPTASGTFSFTILIQLTDGDFMSKPYTIAVAGFITTSPLTSPVVGQPYANRIFVQGFSIPSFAITSGTLSPGLIFNSDGTFGGTATSVSTNPFTVTVTETDPAFTSFACSQQYMMSKTNTLAYFDFSQTISPWIDDSTSATLAFNGFSSGVGFIGNGVISPNSSVSTQTALVYPLDSTTSTGVTLWMWVRPVDITSTTLLTSQFLLGSSVMSITYHIIPGIAQLAQFFVGPTSGQSNLSFTTGTWHLLALTYNKNSNQITMWVDGVAATTIGGGAAVFVTGSYKLFMSGNANISGNRMDEIGVWWGGAASASKISSLYNGGLGVTWPTPQSIFP